MPAPIRPHADSPPMRQTPPRCRSPELARRRNATTMRLELATPDAAVMRATGRLAPSSSRSHAHLHPPEHLRCRVVGCRPPPYNLPLCWCVRRVGSSRRGGAHRASTTRSGTLRGAWVAMTYWPANCCLVCRVGSSGCAFPVASISAALSLTQRAPTRPPASNAALAPVPRVRLPRAPCSPRRSMSSSQFLLHAPARRQSKSTKRADTTRA